MIDSAYVCVVLHRMVQLDGSGSVPVGVGGFVAVVVEMAGHHASTFLLAMPVAECCSLSPTEAVIVVAKPKPLREA